MTALQFGSAIFDLLPPLLLLPSGASDCKKLDSNPIEKAHYFVNIFLE